MGSATGEEEGHAPRNQNAGRYSKAFVTPMIGWCQNFPFDIKTYRRNYITRKKTELISEYEGKMS